MHKGTRRWFLKAGVATSTIGLSGCSGAPSDSNNESAVNKTTTPATSSRSASNQAAWPMFQYDSRNSGLASENTGPKANIREKWVHKTDAYNIYSSPTVANGLVFFGSDKTLLAVAASDGTTKWSFTSNSDISATACGNDTVYATAGNEIYAVTVRDGLKLWRNRKPMGGLAPPIINGKQVFVVDAWGSLYAVTGPGIAWKNASESRAPARNSEIAASDNRAIIARETGNIYAVSIESGKTLWSKSFDDGIKSAPTIANGSVYIITMGAEGTIISLSASDGSEQWRKQTPWIRASPAVTGNAIYAGDDEGTIHAFSTDGQSKLWTADTKEFTKSYASTGFGKYNSPVIADGVLYIGDYKGRVFALSTTDGSLKWVYELPEKVTTTPAVHDESIFVGAGGNMYALSGDT